MLVALLVLLMNTVQAQDSDRFRNFHGLVVEGNHFFEAEGTEIFIRLSEHSLDEKGISKMTKAFQMKGAQRKDTVIGKEAVVLVKKEMQNGAELTSVCYLLWKDDYLTTAIGFASFKRDVSLEHFLVQAWLNKTVPKYVYTTLSVTMFDFAGRNLPLGGACRWMSPHNVQCPDYGQMSWSLFDSEQAAQEHRDLKLAMLRNKNLTNVQEQKEVPVMFEGVEVMAIKLRVKIKVPKLIMGGSNVLEAYYIVAKVREKYVSCVLSQYTDDAREGTLAPLLAEVMSLK